MDGFLSELTGALIRGECARRNESALQERCKIWRVFARYLPLRSSSRGRSAAAFFSAPDIPANSTNLSRAAHFQIPAQQDASASNRLRVFPWRRRARCTYRRRPQLSRQLDSCIPRYRPDRAHRFRRSRIQAYKISLGVEYYEDVMGAEFLGVPTSHRCSTIRRRARRCREREMHRRPPARLC
jgi:hypothetical protein